MSSLLGVNTLLAVLQKHNLVLPLDGPEREALEKDLNQFILGVDNAAYDLGLDRGFEMAQMAGDY